MAKRTVPPEAVDENLARVVVTLVDRVGMRNMLLALAGIACTKSVEVIVDEPMLGEKWKTVSEGLERFARTRLQGLG